MFSLMGLQVGALPVIGYIGPGPGLSMLGALFGLIATVVAALGAVLLWPIRAMLGNLEDEDEGAEEASDETAQTSADDDAESSDDPADDGVEVAGDDNPETSDLDDSTGASASAR